MRISSPHLNEVAVLAELKHPNIVDFIGVPREMIFWFSENEQCLGYIHVQQRALWRLKSKNGGIETPQYEAQYDASRNHLWSLLLYSSRYILALDINVGDLLTSNTISRYDGTAGDGYRHSKTSPSSQLLCCSMEINALMILEISKVNRIITQPTDQIFKYPVAPNPSPRCWSLFHSTTTPTPTITSTTCKPTQQFGITSTHCQYNRKSLSWSKDPRCGWIDQPNVRYSFLWYLIQSAQSSFEHW